MEYNYNTDIEKQCPRCGSVVKTTTPRSNDSCTRGATVIYTCGTVLDHHSHSYDGFKTFAHGSIGVTKQGETCVFVPVPGANYHDK